jgi:uncharacterized protein
MQYIVDGYNLLFRIAKDRRSLKKNRQEIISMLNDWVASLKLNISIVFDGAEQTSDQPSRGHWDALEIVYTPKKISADEYIIEEIHHCSNPKQKVVVTSDRELANHCKALGAQIQTISEFLSWILKKKERKRKSSQSTAISSKTFKDTDANIARLLAIFEKRLSEENS